MTFVEKIVTWKFGNYDEPRELWTHIPTGKKYLPLTYQIQKLEYDNLHTVLRKYNGPLSQLGPVPTPPTIDEGSSAENVADAESNQSENEVPVLRLPQFSYRILFQLFLFCIFMFPYISFFFRPPTLPYRSLPTGLDLRIVFFFW